MAGIPPVSGLSGSYPARPIAPTVAPPASAPAGEAPSGGFGEVLKAFVDNVDARQKASVRAVQDLVTGKTGDLLPVVNEVAKADLSFKLLLGVRNKVIEAYKETMRMQI